MKVYLSFDIEGISGVADSRDIEVGSLSFPAAMRASTQDVNAAIEGALAVGATEVFVCDGHGRDRRNLIYEELHPSATLFRGRVSTEWLNMPVFDTSYDAVFFIGWHARASAPGILSHCFNSRVFTDWRVNGVPVGEPEFAAALAGHYNVPLVLVTGDDCTCSEVKIWHPDCECVVTKYALDRVSAVCLPRETTYQAIKQGAERALRRAKEIPPFHFAPPLSLQVSTVFDYSARALTLIPGVQQTDLLTVSFQARDALELCRVAQAMLLISIATE